MWIFPFLQGWIRVKGTETTSQDWCAWQSRGCGQSRRASPCPPSSSGPIRHPRTQIGLPTNKNENKFRLIIMNTGTGQWRDVKFGRTLLIYKWALCSSWRLRIGKIRYKKTVLHKKKKIQKEEKDKRNILYPKGCSRNCLWTSPLLFRTVRSYCMHRSSKLLTRRRCM